MFPPIRVPLVIPPLPSPPLNERVIRIPMTVPGSAGVRRLTLEATLYRPPGPGPFPLVVLSHGTPRNIEQRVAQGRLTYSVQSWKFVSMGFAVVIPMRRGYGHSEGGYAEDEGPLDQANFYQAGVESARDLRATVEYMSALPFIDPQRLVLAGHSSGGFASLILASRGLPGVRGIINFNGGRGSAARFNCSPDRLIEACGLAGRTTRVPTLWIYSENDSYFPPRLAREMHAAFHRAGGRGEFVMLPPFCEEGHFLFTDVRGLGLWTPVVSRFLNELGFPGLM
jgi:dienelactone hydrolase